jgi:hypothetical protein
MRLRREGNFVFVWTRDGWRFFATMERGSWCRSTLDSIGQPQLEPLPVADQKTFAGLPEGKEVEL